MNNVEEISKKQTQCGLCKKYLTDLYCSCCDEYYWGGHDSDCENDYKRHSKCSSNVHIGWLGGKTIDQL